MSDDYAGRLPLLAPQEMTGEQRELYEAIAGGPRAGGPFRMVDDRGRLLGPFNALLYRAPVGQAVQALGAALRFGSSLPDRTRELVICAVAAHWRSRYEWYAHSRVAQAVGVSAAELDAVGDGREPDGLAAGEAAALRLATALLRERAVDDDTHAAVVAEHGDAGVVEISVLVGYYQMLGGLLAAADVPVPQDDEAPHDDQGSAR